MNRHRKLGLNEAVDKLYLFLTGMAGYVNILVSYAHSFLKELVDDLGYGFLITRDGMG